MSEIHFETAGALTARIQKRDLSAVEVMEAHLRQIDAVNPRVNAIVTLCAEQALERASALDAALARGESPGPLAGLPIAHKDLVETRGVRTTWGSTLFRDFVPDFDALIVERLRRAGAISVGKTNVPEFGAGSHTFNRVFGATRNPYDPSRTCGGSSGGAAVALACGMVPIADGSDMGGSLRNPANFCNVVGFRTSPGRVPVWPARSAWSHFSVLGPMARTVADAALMLSAIAGPDPRAPIAIAEPGEPYRHDLERDFSGVRIAWSRDLGELPVDPRVAAAIEPRLGVFEDLGCAVEESHPDFRDADEVFKTGRAQSFESGFAGLAPEARSELKETVRWNLERGLELTGADVSRAERKRTELYHRVRQFMETREYLVMPVSQVPPFDLEQEYPTEIDGEVMETYIDWMKSCYFITITGLPAISVPCGFTPEGLPVGVQIVGRHQQDFAVLQLAHAFERATQTWKRRPDLASSRSATRESRDARAGELCSPITRQDGQERTQDGVLGQAPSSRDGD